jgi:hypothetical protein
MENCPPLNGSTGEGVEGEGASRHGFAKRANTPFEPTYSVAAGLRDKGGYGDRPPLRDRPLDGLDHRHSREAVASGDGQLTTVQRTLE